MFFANPRHLKNPVKFGRILTLPRTHRRSERRLAAGFARPFRPNGWKKTTGYNQRKR